MLRRVLIANRGEIAVRVIRACAELGIETVAVYSEADADALHVSLATVAVLLGPAPARESYLRGAAVIEAACAIGCDAIHPGYGFLSENADFAAAVEEAGLVWIGPPAAAIRAMGSKIEARAAMEAAGVPVVPGYRGGGDREAFVEAAEALGFPVLVKATAGGGGKGMRLVERAEELGEAIDGARREAAAAFGNEQVYLEKYLGDARHVEIQVLADAHGTTVHLFDRECSVQRRHQKVVEESPSPLLDPALRAKMGAAAVAAAEATGYRNAGTVEFLVDADRSFYFLEMNTRLQVEHPVTELVTGVDLVQAQLRVAAGERLELRQEELVQRGHAVECRIYAEDPANDHLPSTGTILRLAQPEGPGIRVDSGVREGGVISHHYDPLLAKLVVWGEDRAAALRKLDWALSQYAVLGVTTNIPFLRAIIGHEVFQAGNATTRFIEEHLHSWKPEAGASPDEVFIAAALAAVSARPARDGSGPAEVDPHSPWGQVDGFRLGEGGGR